jgi:double-strand break repair protein AddB
VHGERPLSDWLEHHLERAERIAAGSASTDGVELWAKTAGRELRKIVTELQHEACHGGALDARDYADLFGAVLARGEVRDRDAPHPHILIWGTLEARVMGADLLILAGLNEGTWPEMPGADPWLNRKMRHDAALLLPERRIGLSAHDFQQAFGACEVWLTRAARSDDAETVPSRWLNRLGNLMDGLPNNQGPEARKAMRERGDHWLSLARALETPIPSERARRPSPVPPVASRPTQLSVTRIKHLIRDPYAIYAQYVLRLRPLNPLQRAPDALMRGILIHDVMERFVKDILDHPDHLTPENLIALSRQVLADDLPFPTMRHLWQARVARIADWFVTSERARQNLAQPHPDRLEIPGKAVLPGLNFTLTATADRIDLDSRGNAYIYDYKTGAPPSKDAQKHFDKQLLLEAAMVENGAFAPLEPRHTERASFIGLGASPTEVAAPLEDLPPAEVWVQFQYLVQAYFDPDQGFTARRAMLKESDVSDYDHLARYGEWDTADAAVKQVLT